MYHPIKDTLMHSLIWSGQMSYKEIIIIAEIHSRIGNRFPKFPKITSAPDKLEYPINYLRCMQYTLNSKSWLKIKNASIRIWHVEIRSNLRLSSQSRIWQLSTHYSNQIVDLMSCCTKAKQELHHRPMTANSKKLLSWKNFLEIGSSTR